MKLASLLFLFLFNAMASGKKADAEPSKEIINIAQNLILQKDREQAIRILNKALVIEKNKNTIQEIKSILTDIGSLFLYDKAQQEYESSINFKKSEPSKWFAAVERALKIEPDNTLVAVEVIRNHLNKKNLDKAKDVLEEFRSKNPLDKNMIVSSIFLSLAGGDVKEASLARIKLKDLQLSNFAVINTYFDLLEKVIAGSRDKTQTALTVFKKEDAQNPQATYWENRISGKTRSDDEPVCPSFPEHYYRRYYYDLFFCSPALDNYFKFKDANL
jgi:Tfp pilus assembly protein PilF